MSADPSLRGYLEEAASWDGERDLQMRRSARLAWRVAGGAGLCVLALTVALVALLPLKRVQPYLIRVDTRTGVVDVVPPYRGGTDFGRTVARYFLMRYIAVCERFDYALAEADYEQCGAFNSGALNEAMYARWARGNPHSPLNVHRDGSTVSVHIEAVSFLGRAPQGARLAQVRFERITRQVDGTPQGSGQWIATLTYRFAGAPVSPAVRRWNPLGFEVTALQLDRDVLAPSSPVPPGKTRS